MIFSPYLNNAMSVLLTFTSAALSISLLFCSSSSFFVGLLKFLSSTGFSESFSFQSRSLSVSTLQFNFDFLLKIQKGVKMQDYDKSTTKPLKFFKSLTSTGKNTGPSPLSLVGVSFNKAVIRDDMKVVATEFGICARANLLVVQWRREVVSSSSKQIFRCSLDV